MAESVILLSVDGGDTESFIGAYRTRESMEVAMRSEGTGEASGREEGYVYSDIQIDAEGREIIYLHEEGEEPFDYTLCFIIHTTPILD